MFRTPLVVISSLEPFRYIGFLDSRFHFGLICEWRLLSIFITRWFLAIFFPSSLWNHSTRPLVSTVLRLWPWNLPNGGIGSISRPMRLELGSEYKLTIHLSRPRRCWIKGCSSKHLNSAVTRSMVQPMISASSEHASICYLLPGKPSAFSKLLCRISKNF